MVTAATAGQTPPEVAPQPQRQTSDEPLTFWENVAQTRWGQYVTAIERQALLDAHAAFPAPGIGLEVGCEGGRWCRILTGLGWRMIGTDTNLRALQLCQQRNPTVRCVHVEASEQSLPADTASIDLLICVEVPVVDEDWFLSEARRVLKPGGMFLGSVMNMHSWRGMVANAKAKLLRKQSFYHRPYRSFRRELRRNGFEFRTEEGYCWAPFGRHSDSRLVPAATAIEQRSGLRHLPVLSPWILFTAVRQ